jgi:hypothetical protein
MASLIETDISSSELPSLLPRIFSPVHWNSTKDPNKTKDLFRSFFSQMTNIDFTEPSPFVFHCKAYIHHQEIVFTLAIYMKPEAGYIIEFHQLAGDRYLSSNICNSIKMFMVQNEIILPKDNKNTGLHPNVRAKAKAILASLKEQSATPSSTTPSSGQPFLIPYVVTNEMIQQSLLHQLISTTTLYADYRQNAYMILLQNIEHEMTCKAFFTYIELTYTVLINGLNDIVESIQRYSLIILTALCKEKDTSIKDKFIADNHIKLLEKIAMNTTTKQAYREIVALLRTIQPDNILGGFEQNTIDLLTPYL